MLEKEFKFSLNEAEYNRLYTIFTKTLNHEKITNTNYYFLRENKFSIRARKSNIYELTVKEEVSKNVKKEYNFNLTEQEFNNLLRDGLITKKEELLNLGLKDLNKLPLGSLTTDRINITEAHFIISLDKSTYFDQTDYEIELEQIDPAANLEKELAYLIDKYQLTNEQTLSKQARFFKRKESLND